MDIVVRKLSDEEKETLGIYDWPIWRKGVASFEWTYNNEEECYIIEGEAEVETPDGKKYTIGADDFVSFPKGLCCTWHIKKSIRKHYRIS
jgi:uncharacterized cupin superfamily protein